MSPIQTYRQFYRQVCAVEKNDSTDDDSPPSRRFGPRWQRALHAATRSPATQEPDQPRHVTPKLLLVENDRKATIPSVQRNQSTKIHATTNFALLIMMNNRNATSTLLHPSASSSLASMTELEKSHGVGYALCKTMDNYSSM